MELEGTLPGSTGKISNSHQYNGPVVKLLYDQPVNALTYAKRTVKGWYSVYSYTFVFNLMDWWEQLMMHGVLWIAVGLAAWGIYHQGTSFAVLASSFVKEW